MIKNLGISLLSFTMLGLVFSGCASQPKPLYNYGDYSTSYYHSKQEVGPETALTLQKSIENAIENSSDSLSGRVAPGMYANLGYIYLKSGNYSKAVENFNNEKRIYPESVYFMNRMLKKIKVVQEENK
ncbi:MAG: hypothetical protein ACI9TV_001508 [Sulfurimonas sp.]|jgi:hypothetical protein|uniref:DUF4810 domain-containing protein n=1 Tax=Sulfurimonas sp. TaxID=2022749 RepID=UPI0039E63A88